LTYDLIGDVHGQFSKLSSVLEHLGYEKRKKVYSRKDHCAIFIGDLVDRGSNSREVIELVKRMVEEGHAEAIMGNHEYNLFGYLTEGAKGKFLRPHSQKNERQVRETLASYSGHENALDTHLEWISNLPLYLNNKDFRAVHACWDKKSINYIKKSVGRKMDKEILIGSYKCGTKLEQAVKMIVSGPEMSLPDKIVQRDIDGNLRHNFRYKWWNAIKKSTYQEVAVKDSYQLPAGKVVLPTDFVNREYDEGKKPVFFGHYSMKGKPSLMKSNVCCLDWIDKRNRIGVYRLKPGEKLTHKNFKFFF
tara:strand:- start:4902 stop:5813 length:912 start_codon:yes stop_codon:yes gene_type:complete